MLLTSGLLFLDVRERGTCCAAACCRLPPCATPACPASQRNRGAYQFPIHPLPACSPTPLLAHLPAQAALSTPGDGRTIVAVACAQACQRMLGDCLGPVDPSAPAEEQQRSAAQVGAAFSMAEGGMTIVNWPQVSCRRTCAY